MRHLIYYIFNHWEWLIGLKFIPFILNAGGSGAQTVGQLSNNSNSLLSTASTGANQFNTQLQGILGNYLSSQGPSSNAVSNIATTGGYTPTQIAAQEGQATQAAQSAYSTAGDQFNRMVAASGGYGPSGAASDMLARQGSQAGANATENVLSTISQNQAGNQLAAAGLNSQQIQQLLGTILGNMTSYNSAANQTLATQAGINTSVAPGITGASNLIGSIGGLLP